MNAYLAHDSILQSTERSKNRNPSRISMLSWKSLACATRNSSLSVAKKHLGREQWKCCDLTEKPHNGSGHGPLYGWKPCISWKFGNKKRNVENELKVRLKFEYLLLTLLKRKGSKLLKHLLLSQKDSLCKGTGGLSTHNFWI